MKNKEQKSLRVPSRFKAFNPDERNVLLQLITGHLNTVSQIAIPQEIRVAEYLRMLERLEAECNQANF